jgi:hypothetical protein
MAGHGLNSELKLGARRDGRCGVTQGYAPLGVIKVRRRMW